MITLGDKNELFLDDFLIDKQNNITLDLLRPERKETVLILNEPWEGKCCSYQSVVQDPETGRVFLYYRGCDYDDVTCVAVSDDGINFERLDTGDKNIIWRDKYNCHNFAPFYDTNPNCPKGERFKAVSQGRWLETLITYYSADGISWHKYSDTPIITEKHTFDSLNTAFWDKTIGKYRLYGRYTADKALGEFSEQLREVISYISDDFVHWEKQGTNTYNGEPPKVHVYTNSTRPVPGAEHQFVMMPMRFVPERKKVLEHDTPKGAGNGVSDCVLYSSRDGRDWNIIDSRPWIYPGIDLRQWTHRNFIVSAGIVDKNDEFSVYVGNHIWWDDNQFVRYSVPKMRFGYLYSIDGEFTTKPFILDGDRLTFNYNTSAVGTMTVTVLDENFKPIEGKCFKTYGNELAYPIDLSELNGRTLRLNIKLQDAYIYSIGY